MRKLERITFDPAVMGGRPCIRGLRVTVRTLVGLLAAGKSREDILTLFPYLEPADIDEALTYAAWRAEESRVTPQAVKLVVDMNLPPAWVPVLEAGGHTAVHWSAIGDGRAPDAEVMAWARTNGFVVFTHDLDFGALLALTAQLRLDVRDARVHRLQERVDVAPSRGCRP